MTDIEKREKALFDMMEDFSMWRDVTKMNAKDENVFACRYNDTAVVFDKIDAFIYRVLVYDMSPKVTMSDLEAAYLFNIETGTMIMEYDSYQARIKDNSAAIILTDLFGGIEEYFTWINKPIHIDADEDLSKRKTFDDFLNLIKSGKLFEGEMEVDDDEDKHN